MGLFVGYFIDDAREGMPISTGNTDNDALKQAIYRVLCMGAKTGEIATKDVSGIITPLEFEQLKGVLDKWADGIKPE